MLLIYTSQITNRLSYTFNLVLKEHNGIEFKVTNQSSEWSQHPGPKVKYGGENAEWQADDLLFETGIRADFKPDDPGNKGPDSCDLFAVIFYLISRYEEYQAFQPDKHGRFTSSSSVLKKWNRLQTPYADILSDRIVEKLLVQFPQIQRKKRKYSFQPTLDIDNAYAYKGKGFTRHLGGYIKSILTNNLNDFFTRRKVLSGEMNDPFDTYSFQEELHKKHNLSPIYFFLLADWAPNDKNLSYQSVEMKALIGRLHKHSTLGIHPSYASNTEPDKVIIEKQRLAAICNSRVVKSRQHFLKLSLPGTYRTLLNSGLKEDYTMGYADDTGFRAGSCIPFKWYDIEKEESTDLMIYPFAVMDGTLNQYLNLNPEKSIERVRLLIDQVKMINGNFICIWHNESLSDWREWKGWRKVYDTTVEFASSL